MNLSNIARRIRHSRATPFVALLLAVLFVWFAIDLAVVTLGAEDDHAAHADVILLLGCRALQDGTPTPCIRARSRHAASLYKQGLAPRIIASGGPSLSGPAEAGVMANLLREDGVPEAAIIQEDRSHNTIQNVLYSLQIMRERGWRTAVLVTEPYHINRAQIIARDSGLIVYSSPATDSPDWQSPLARPIKLAQDAVKLMYYQAKSTLGIRDQN
jgi:uncharacterized SAM-binding protein YcdF (DUF218 family)